MAPRALQEASRRLQEASRQLQEAPGALQEASRRLQEASRQLQEAPQFFQPSFGPKWEGGVNPSTMFFCTDFKLSPRIFLKLRVPFMEPASFLNPLLRATTSPIVICLNPLLRAKTSSKVICLKEGDTPPQRAVHYACPCLVTSVLCASRPGGRSSFSSSPSTVSFSAV